MKVYIFVALYGGCIEHVEAFSKKKDAEKRWEYYTEVSYNEKEEVPDEMIDGTHVWEVEVNV